MGGIPTLCAISLVVASMWLFTTTDALALLPAGITIMDGITTLLEKTARKNVVVPDTRLTEYVNVLKSVPNPVLGLESMTVVRGCGMETIFV